MPIISQLMWFWWIGFIQICCFPVLVSKIIIQIYTGPTWMTNHVVLSFFLLNLKHIKYFHSKPVIPVIPSVSHSQSKWLGCHSVNMLIQCTPLLVGKAGVAPDMTFRITAHKQERVQARDPLRIWNLWGRTHKVQNRSNQWLHKLGLGPTKIFKKKKIPNVAYTRDKWFVPRIVYIWMCVLNSCLNISQKHIFIDHVVI